MWSQKPVSVHPGKTGGNYLIGRSVDIIWYEPDFQGPGLVIKNSILGPIIPITGLTDTADIKNILAGRIDQKNSPTKGPPEDLLAVTGHHFQPVGMTDKTEPLLDFLKGLLKAPLIDLKQIAISSEN